MPKIAESSLVKMKRFVREFGDVFTINTDVKTNIHILYCQSCLVKVNCDQRFQVTQHVNTGQHQKSIKNWKTKQITVQESIAKSQNEFNKDLCKFLVSLNIPFDKLLNPEFKSFIEKYTQYTSPDPSTLRKSYLKQLYNSVMVDIRKQLDGQYVWISIDETTDCAGRYVSNVIVGSLNPIAERNVKFLLNMEFLDKTNNFTIVQSVNNALMVLWPEGIKYDKVLLLD
jgi:hypothetical protein